MNDVKKSSRIHYNSKKVNISIFREICNLIENFSILFHELYKNKIMFTRFHKYKIKKYLKSLKNIEVEQKVMNFYKQKLEAIRISKYHVMTIFKKESNFLSYDDLIDLILDLKMGVHYIACYGLYSSIKSDYSEIIDLFDFNFHFKNKEDIRKVVQILQILDSEDYKFKEFESISGRFFLYNNFEKLKKVKYLKRDKSKYIYLDSDDFEIFDRLPDFYPDHTKKILQDPRLNM